MASRKRVRWSDNERKALMFQAIAIDRAEPGLDPLVLFERAQLRALEPERQRAVRGLPRAIREWFEDGLRVAHALFEAGREEAQRPGTVLLDVAPIVRTVVASLGDTFPDPAQIDALLREVVTRGRTLEERLERVESGLAALQRALEPRAGMRARRPEALRPPARESGA